MNEPKIARKKSFHADVEEGRTYWWCACGLSEKQPYCDSSHKGTGFSPVKFTAEASKKVFLCGCKHTKTPPFCDGTHRQLD